LDSLLLSRHTRLILLNRGLAISYLLVALILEAPIEIGMEGLALGARADEMIVPLAINFIRV
jgi:hypothetical protein